MGVSMGMDRKSVPIFLESIRNSMTSIAKSFFLEVGKAEVFLNLKHGGKVVERVLVGDGYSLAEKLLPAIDGLLRKHDLRTEDIETFEVASDLPDGYSSRRIAETVAMVYGFAVK